MKNSVDKFNVQVCFQAQHKRKFCVVSSGLEFSENVDMKVDMFLKYHLAFRPRVSVVLFELEQGADVGSPLYHYGKTTLYHLPPDLYDTLDESVMESEFIMSQQLLAKLIDTNRVYASIFQCLAQEHHENGLNVLGVFYEAEEA